MCVWMGRTFWWWAGEWCSVGQSARFVADGSQQTSHVLFSTRSFIQCRRMSAPLRCRAFIDSSRTPRAVAVNTSSGLNATRHPVHKAAKLAPASQTSSAREHSVRTIKPLKSVRGSPTRLSHHRDHRDNTRRITRLGKKPFPPE